MSHDRISPAITPESAHIQTLPSGIEDFTTDRIITAPSLQIGPVSNRQMRRQGSIDLNEARNPRMIKWTHRPPKETKGPTNRKEAAFGQGRVIR